MYQGRIRVHYPLERGRLVLRTEKDWARDVEPSETAEGGQRFEFEITFDRPHLDFKPCIREGESVHWSEGANKLAILDGETENVVYPRFRSGFRGAITEVLRVPSPLFSRDHRVRAYLPAGCDENRLKRYPVVYVLDGRNLFFPEEAFLGQEWEVDETLDVLDWMNAIDQTIVVGIYAENRGRDYTSPGYERYGRALVEELKPEIDSRFRTLADRGRTGLLGASLGGVAAFHIAWGWPEVFGNVGCLSSTFSYRDDLIDRVRESTTDRRRHLKLYLDSGWPGDNYDGTLRMAIALAEAGFQPGRDFLYLAFPGARHGERAWAERLHIPIQLFSGRIRRVTAASERLAAAGRLRSRSTAVD